MTYPDIYHVLPHRIMRRDYIACMVENKIRLDVAHSYASARRAVDEWGDNLDAPENRSLPETMLADEHKLRELAMVLAGRALCNAHDDGEMLRW